MGSFLPLLLPAAFPLPISLIVADVSLFFIAMKTRQTSFKNQKIEKGQESKRRKDLVKCLNPR